MKELIARFDVSTEVYCWLIKQTLHLLGNRVKNKMAVIGFVLSVLATIGIFIRAWWALSS